MRGAMAKLAMVLGLLAVAGCGAKDGGLPSAGFVPINEGPGEPYVVGPLDNLEIFVWRNPELSTSVTVRPDGRFSVPLIDDMAATGRTPTQLARDIEKKLAEYIQSPIVTVIVSGFQGPFAQQVRVVGSATQPQAIPYRANMTLLDLMIAVGGTTEFAAGNRAVLARVENGTQKEYNVRIDDLLKDGDTSANVKINPGDVVIIPESFF
ncbi:polysaccharide export protein [Emcibacter nanhaiensis]|uniref:Polysaccharide export protein n=2 Tax=Emcibacter nanhaiensis TaxID=1505037 RepID=A0A501PC15_9PROT|nr:polysaccharide export protein [Emcibacter nanhaiensis]